MAFGRNYAIGVIMSAIDKVSGPMRGIRASLGGFTTGARGASGAGLNLSTMFKSMVGGITAVAAAAGAAGAAIFKLANDSINYGDTIADVAGSIGMSNRALQEYRYMAGIAGLSAQEMDAALTKMTVNLGKESGEVERALESIGLAVDEVRASAPDYRLELIADAMAKIKDPTQLAAITTALFGKSTSKLTTTLAAGSDAIRELRNEANEVGAVMSDEFISTADKASDSMFRFQTRMKVFATGIGANLIPSVLSATDAISQWTLDNEGMVNGFLQNVGGMIGSLITILVPLTGVVSGILSPVFMVVTQVLTAVMPVINSVIGAIGGLVPVIATILSLAITLLQPVFGLIEKLGVLLGKILTPVIAVVAVAVEALAEVIEAVVSPVILIITDYLGMLVDVIGNFLTPVLDALPAVIKIATRPFIFFANMVKILISIIGGLLRPVWAFVSGASGAFSRLLSRVSGVASGIMGFFSNAWDWVIGGAKATSQFISDVFTGVATWVKEAWTGVGDFFVGLWDGIGNIFQAGVAWVMELISPLTDALSWVVDGVSSLFGGGKTSTQAAPVTRNAPPIRDGMPGAPGRNGEQKTEVVVDFKNMPRGTRVQSEGARQGLNMSMGYANVGF